MTANIRPAAIRAAFLLWLGAVATAIIEVLARFASEPVGVMASIATSGTEIAVRLTAYAVLITLALLMRARRNFARHLLTAIFGGFGLASLVIEPVRWAIDGGDVAAFLAAADVAMWVMIASRVAHILWVVGAVILAYRPSANAWFRSAHS